MVSVPYFTVFGFLTYNFLHVCKLYDTALLNLETLPNFVGDCEGIYRLQWLKFEHFFLSSKETIFIKEFIEI